jgi:HEAT repeat protein
VATRQAAVGALNSIGHPDMAARIPPMLTDTDPLVRESAVKIAGYFGYPQCTEPFLACCTDEDETVRAAAVEHLPYFDDPRVLGVLATAISSDSGRTRAAAAKALAAVPDSAAHALLEKSLHDTEPWVRYFSAISLGQQRVSRALDELARAASSDFAPHVRVAAVEAVGAIGGEHAARLLEPVAAEYTDSGLAAIRVLGRVESDSVFTLLSEAVRSSSSARRLAAIDALSNWADERAVQPLQWAVAGDEDPAVARAALDALGIISARNTRAARPAVRALLVQLADPAKRAHALAVLGRLPVSAVPFLSELFGDDDPRIRRGVVEALGRLTYPAASACLQKALADTDAVVRREAIRALSRFGTRGVAKRLSSMADGDPAPAVRQAAAAALSRHGDRQRDA